MENNINPYKDLLEAILSARRKIKPINALQPINPYGRPTVMTENVMVRLREAFLFGCTDEQACSFANIATGTLYNYQKAHPDYLEQKEQWKQNPILMAKAVVYNKLSELETAKWYLERKAKEEFGTRQELTGAGGKDLITDKLDSIEKTNYEQFGREAEKQIMEDDKPL